MESVAVAGRMEYLLEYSFLFFQCLQFFVIAHLRCLCKDTLEWTTPISTGFCMKCRFRTGNKLLKLLIWVVF